MNRPERTVCEQMQDLIETYLDGAGTRAQTSAFESHVETCNECAAELALARQVRTGLDSLPLQNCPVFVSEAVLDYAAARPLAARRPWWSLVWRPALVGAVAVLLLAITGYVGQNGKQATPQFTHAELEQAQKQAKWTLVFINQLSRRTATNLKQDVIDPHVSRTLQRIINSRHLTNPKET